MPKIGEFFGYGSSFNDYCAVFCQMVCTQQAEEDETVLGLHLTGPNAGEVLQGFAVAME